MNRFLRRTDVINWDHPAVMHRAKSLAGSQDVVEVAKACFEWVRDEVMHSRDYERGPATWRASGRGAKPICNAWFDGVTGR